MFDWPREQWGMTCKGGHFLRWSLFKALERRAKAALVSWHKGTPAPPELRNAQCKPFLNSAFLTDGDGNRCGDHGGQVYEVGGQCAEVVMHFARAA